MKRALTTIFIAAIAVQIYVIWSTYAGPLAKTIWEMRGNSHLERAALLMPWMSDEQREFIWFLKGATPENARIVFPPTHEFHPKGSERVIQFLLAPRASIFCTDLRAQDCVSLEIEHGSYVVRMDDFPEPASGLEFMSYQAFSQERGLFSPN